MSPALDGHSALATQKQVAARQRDLDKRLQVEDTGPAECNLPDKRQQENSPLFLAEKRNRFEPQPDRRLVMGE